MTRSPMHQQIDTLPDLVRAVARPFDESARRTFDFELCTSLKRIYLVGCGDSYHASYGAELAFHQLAGVPTQALSALTFSRYTAGYLADTGPNTNLTIAVSVSGVVSRTIEALRLAQRAGAVGVALTGNPGGPLAASVPPARVFTSAVPPLPDELNSVVPGVRSYLASQMALYSAAIRIGEVRGHLTTAQADDLRRELVSLAEVMAQTIAVCEPICRNLVQAWHDAPDFVFTGAGPLYGAAMFSAAKVLEGSGDAAMAQETEEWAHLQYFALPTTSATFFLDAGGFSSDRMAEIARAAHAIGRRMATIIPAGTDSPAGEGTDENAIRQYAHTVIPIQGSIRECFTPLVFSIPGSLIAAERAALLNAAYFRAFGAGRQVEWADGASRIRDSHLQEEVLR